MVRASTYASNLRSLKNLVIEKIRLVLLFLVGRISDTRTILRIGESSFGRQKNRRVIWFSNKRFDIQPIKGKSVSLKGWRYGRMRYLPLLMLACVTSKRGRKTVLEPTSEPSGKRLMIFLGLIFSMPMVIILVASRFAFLLRLYMTVIPLLRKGKSKKKFRYWSGYAKN